MRMAGALRQRRLALVQRSCAQRERLAEAASPFAARLAAVDRLGARLRAHPVAAALGLAAVWLLGPRRLLLGALRALTVLSLVRRAARALSAARRG